MTKNYHDILGVSQDASSDEIKRAYRRLAMKYHPDRNQKDKRAEEKFKNIKNAYEVLCNPKNIHKAIHEEPFQPPPSPRSSSSGSSYSSYSSGSSYSSESSSSSSSLNKLKDGTLFIVSVISFLVPVSLAGVWLLYLIIGSRIQSRVASVLLALIGIAIIWIRKRTKDSAPVIGFLQYSITTVIFTAITIHFATYKWTNSTVEFGLVLVTIMFVIVTGLSAFAAILIAIYPERWIDNDG